MDPVRNVLSAPNNEEKPLRPSKDVMKNRLQQLFDECAKKAESFDAQSLVDRAMIGTPEEKSLF